MDVVVLVWKSVKRIKGEEEDARLPKGFFYLWAGKKVKSAHLTQVSERRVHGLYIIINGNVSHRSTIAYVRPYRDIILTLIGCIIPLAILSCTINCNTLFFST